MRRLCSVLLCGSVLASGGIAHAQEGDYRYGQLLVQRQHSTWNNAPTSPAPSLPAARYTPVPSVIPSYSPGVQPPVAPPKAVTPSPVTAAPPPAAPAPEAIMGAYYMPVPPADPTEPSLPPGEPLPASPSPVPVTTPAPSLESQPLVPPALAQNTNTAMYRLPSGAMQTEDRRYVSGTPVPEHPGHVVQTPDGPAFMGPLAANSGYMPSWFKIRFGNGYRKNNVEFNRTGVTPTGETATLKEEWKNIGMYQVKGGADFTNRSGFLDGLYLEGDASYGWTISGKEDTTLTLPSSTEDTPPTVDEKTADADSGNSYMWRAAIGYELSPDFVDRKKAHTSVIPMIGYSFERLELSSSSSNATNGLRNIDYTTEWSGPFVGLKIGVEWPEQRFAFRTAYTYGSYDGSSSSNNPSNPAANATETQETDANGFSFGGNYAVAIYEGIELFIDADLQFWNNRGDTTTVITSGGASAIPLNIDDISWNSQFYQLGLSYRW